jgi:hypothetical protein
VAQRSRSTFKKRQKELARQQRAQDKFARRIERSKKQKEGGSDVQAGEDPDIAGIVPGPQPRQDEDEPGPTG